MCGIIGYTGKRDAAPILLEGLGRLEYRGYDSSGIAVMDRKNGLGIFKAKGRLGVLSKKTDDGKSVSGHCGIGHTRWATHGEPNEVNAHPHLSTDGKVALVHNGIIENYAPLRDFLLSEGDIFLSQTDSEVAANLISYYYKELCDPLKAISTASLRIKGSFAFAIIFSDIDGTIFLSRRDSPLIVGIGDDGVYAASDATAILSHTRRVFYLNNDEIAKITDLSAVFYSLELKEIKKEPQEILWSAEAAERDGYEHFMLKEIEEQPRAVADTVARYVRDGRIILDDVGFGNDTVQKLERIYIVACGSAYHVGAVAKYTIEQMARISVEIDIASEFRYRAPVFVENSLLIVISQSGETADSLAALRLAKKSGVKTLGIVNVVGSSIARESDSVMYTVAGPEISVATTKAYSAQLAAVYILSIFLAHRRGEMDDEGCNRYIRELESLPEKIRILLDSKAKIQDLASRASEADDVFFLGRGVDYASAMEGSLKLKEISYIHSEAYAAGELKHGSISLIEHGSIVVGIMTQNRLFDKMASNLAEVKSRGAFVICITNDEEQAKKDVSDIAITIPETVSEFLPSLTVIPLQFLSYYVGVVKNLDVDKPRNLAKSVTVE